MEDEFKQYEGIDIKDVPKETVLRHKNKKLQDEIEELKEKVKSLNSEIEWRDKAIKDFKQWQSTLINRKAEYWLKEAANRCSDTSEIQLLHKTAIFLRHDIKYRKYADKLIGLFPNVEKEIAKVKDELKEYLEKHKEL